MCSRYFSIGSLCSCFNIGYEFCESRLETHDSQKQDESLCIWERAASEPCFPPSPHAHFSLSLPLSPSLLLLKVGRTTVGRQRCCSPRPLPPSLPPRDQRQTPRATFRTTTSELKNDLATLARVTSAEKGVQAFAILIGPLLWRQPFHIYPSPLLILSLPSSCEELRGKRFRFGEQLAGRQQRREACPGYCCCCCCGGAVVS